MTLPEITSLVHRFIERETKGQPNKELAAYIVANVIEKAVGNLKESIKETAIYQADLLAVTTKTGSREAQLMGAKIGMRETPISYEFAIFDEWQKIADEAAKVAMLRKSVELELKARAQNGEIELPISKMPTPFIVVTIK